MRFVGPDGEGAVAKAVGVLAVVALVAMFVAGSAAAAGNKKLVEGTLYDATCAAACSPCPPPCGPIVQPQSPNDVICAQAQARIACPLAPTSRAQRVFKLCPLGAQVPCGSEFPVYMGEGAVVTVRSRKTGRTIGPLPVVEGRFKVRLGPGYWVIRPYIPPEPDCWTGPQTIEVTAKMKSPVPAVVDVSDRCVAQSDSK
ncbi:MAG TPA: hypothetical protein VGC32_06550 [Solirubrobacterales bacterium]